MKEKAIYLKYAGLGLLFAVGINFAQVGQLTVESASLLFLAICLTLSSYLVRRGA